MRSIFFGTMVAIVVAIMLGGCAAQVVRGSERDWALHPAVKLGWNDVSVGQGPKTRFELRLGDASKCVVEKRGYIYAFEVFDPTGQPRVKATNIAGTVFRDNPLYMQFVEACGKPPVGT